MAKKYLGQHFLFDPSILRRIILAAGLVPDDTVVEIGPGHGRMTRMLAGSVQRIIAIELVGELAAMLREDFAGSGNVEVVHGDALLYPYHLLGSFKVVANIPYYITTPLLFRLLGWVDRSRLLGLSGRSRKAQLQMARDLGIDAFACAAGGCLLTEKLFAARLRDLFKTRTNVSMWDMMVLQVGRRFAVGDARVTVGRDEVENNVLGKLRRPDDYLFEVLNCGSPVTMLEGPLSGPTVEAAARLTARYSDCHDASVTVHYGWSELDQFIEVSPISDSEAAKLRVG